MCKISGFEDMDHIENYNPGRITCGEGRGRKYIVPELTSIWKLDDKEDLRKIMRRKGQLYKHC